MYTLNKREGKDNTDHLLVLEQPSSQCQIHKLGNIPK